MMKRKLSYRWDERGRRCYLVNGRLFRAFWSTGRRYWVVFETYVGGAPMPGGLEAHVKNSAKLDAWLRRVPPVERELDTAANLDLTNLDVDNPQEG